MAEGKYGRLFTEREVRGLIVSAFADGMVALQSPREDPADYAARLIEEMSAPTFPADEPLFLLRGQDKAAPAAIGTLRNIDYASACVLWGASDERVAAAVKAAEAMMEWQAKHPDRVKVPD